MKHRICNTKGMIHLAGEQDRIGGTFMRTIRISERPEKYRGCGETYHCRVGTETEGHARTLEIVRCYCLFKIGDTDLSILEAEVIAQNHLPFDLHLGIIEVLGKRQYALGQLYRFLIFHTEDMKRGEPAQDRK